MIKIRLVERLAKIEYWVERYLRSLMVVCYILVILLGILYVYNDWQEKSKSMTREALALANTLATDMLINEMQDLKVSEEDVGTPNYEIIKSAFMKAAESNTDVRFAYIMVQREEKVYFVVDSELPISDDYSPPGQEYTETDEYLFRALAGDALISPPSTDRWGTWVSALVPIKDGKKILGIVGVDYPAAIWESAIRKSAANAVIHVVLILLFLSLLFREVLKRRTLRAEKNKLEKMYKNNLKLKREAEKASMIKSQFLANMSHELRTPMNAIFGFLQLMKDTEMSKIQEEYIDNGILGARNLLKVINDILDFSKIEAGKMDIEEGTFDLREIVKETMALFRPSAEEKQLVFQYLMDEKLPPLLLGDMWRIRQILNNLLSNAVKFTMMGKVELRVDVIGHREGKVKVLFMVTDTGIGIKKSAFASIFKPFMQADNSITRRFGGTGLGLVIAQELVKMMGGTIDLESNEGQGSKFYFELVLKIAAVEKVEEKGQESRNSEKGVSLVINDALSKKILIVEDDELNVKVLKKMLKRIGLVCDVVNNGSEACDICAEKEYDIILMDCQMPIMDGYEATVRIKRNNELKGYGTLIIAMTANAMKGDKERCLAVGMDDYITKPVEIENLNKVLSSYLNK